MAGLLLQKRTFSGFVLAVGVLIIGLGFSATTDQTLAHPPGEPPTYYHDVAPILATHCITCHVEGGIGTMALDTPELAVEHSSKIALTAAVGDMPPWMPGEATPPLQHERKLTQEEIEILVEWARADAPLGDPSEAVPVTPPPTVSIREDLSLTMPEYTPDSSLNDDYRCFLLDPQLTENRYVTGYTVKPGQPSIVHHVLVFYVNPNTVEAAYAIDNEDSTPGWQCFGGPGIAPRGNGGGNPQPAAQDQTAGSVAGWVPGSSAIVHPAGTGMQLEAGSQLIMQVHYNLSGGAKPDQTRLVLQLSEPGQPIEQLERVRLFAPVEIPCGNNQVDGRCSRDYAVTKSEPRDVWVTQAMLGFCNKTPDDYVSQDGSNVVSSCDFTINEDAQAVAVVGHMHTRGQSIRIELNADSAAPQVLLDIPDWDFHWQDMYQYAEPINLHQGDKIRITCTWDNSWGENLRYIVWGEGTEDEMCLGWVITQPAN